VGVEMIELAAQGRPCSWLKCRRHHSLLGAQT
jgi:hypothetical protein